MNHIEFIEKNVREELIRAGFPVSVAQGGVAGDRPLQAYVSGQ
ncbi:hypothetical protein [Atlantibacter hermannii]|nr:hypothetical protein [Atlantibacter hermannii]